MTCIGLGRLLAFGVVPVFVPLGPRLGVFLLKELVVAVEVSILGVWVEGWAWVRLEAAVVAGGLVVVVAFGVVVGLVNPSIAAVGLSWIARWTVLTRLRLCSCCLKGL